MSYGRTDEIERRLEEALDYIEWLKGEVARLAQLLNQVSGGGYPQSGGSGGVAWAAGVAIAGGGQATGVTVYEVTASGDVEHADQTVVNPHPNATSGDLQLLLGRNRDGSWSVLDESCEEGA